MSVKGKDVSTIANVVHIHVIPPLVASDFRLPAAEQIPVPLQPHLIRRYWESARGFWSTAPATGLAILLISILLLQLLVQYKFNFWNCDFFNALELKSESAIWAQALEFVVLASSSLALAIMSIWARMTTKRKWRAWLSKRLYDFWLGRDRYTKLQFMTGDHQTPEYRIAEDAKVATDLPIDLVLGLIWSFLCATTFIGILWSVGGDLTVSISGGDFTIPRYLVIAVMLYSAIVASATMIISRRLTRVIEESKRTEAELRSIGAYLRQSGESINTLDRPENGQREVGGALDEVIAKWLALCWQNMRMTLVVHTNFLVTPILGLLLCMPKYIDGSMSLGQVIQVASAFVFVQSAFNWITDSYGIIAEWASSANRVASLLIGLDQIDCLPSDNSIIDPGDSGDLRSEA